MKSIYYFLFTCLFLTNLFATTINIPADFATVQEGIDAAQDGDIVLIAQGTYYENLTINKEITLTSNADFDALEENEGWYNDPIILETIINGSVNNNPNKRSCLIIRDGDIQPTIKGLTFEGGVGTSMNLINDCTSQLPERSGGGILIYDAYPTINYNRFINNGISSEEERGRKAAKTGGAIAHYEDAEVEFDEDRSASPANNRPSRTPPATINIQNNYFEGNTSGNGQDFYSHGFDGSIDVSSSVFANIDCETNTVNDFVLSSLGDVADYVQEEIVGACIEEYDYFVAVDGDNNNSGSASAPFATIGHALSFVKEVGDATTIYVGAGVYSPDLTGEAFPIFLPNNVHLVGEDPETTILDADADETKEAAVVIINEVETVTLKNFTLTNGYSEGHGCTGGGGLLLAANDMFNLMEGDDENATGRQVFSYPVIENVIIDNNYSHNGGGLGIFRVVGPVLTNVTISNNVASAFGGGVFSYVSGVTMTNVTITENQNLGNGQGGGIMLANTSGTFDNMTITNNTAVGSHGGGIWTNHSDDWVMTNSIISGNSAGWFGGAICMLTSAPTMINVAMINNTAGWGAGAACAMWSSPALKQCLISGNTGDGGGGGIQAFGEGAFPIIEDCKISGNTATGNGGGILLDGADGAKLTRVIIVNNHANGIIGGIDVTGTNAAMTNVTLSANTSGQGGAIGVFGGGHVELTNSIVWNHDGPGNFATDGTGTINITYSDIEGGFDGIGNIDEDPLFAGIHPQNDFYSLQENSPCIDVGTADTDGNGVDDITSYYGIAPDMGAFEYSLPDPPPPPAPLGLGYEIQGSSVVLTWDHDDTMPIMYYSVEKSLDTSFTSDVEVHYALSNNFIDTDVEENTQYFYRISYYVGQWSEYSDIIAVVFNAVMAVAETGNVPAVYSIHQNYPNPFNPMTTINYELPRKGFVNIRVYDLMGRNIRSLINTVQDAGYRSVQWNATNDLGQPVTAGMYIYTIQAGDFRQTKKMLLLK
jgi:parallel beta-helix repeat protein